MNCKKCNFPMEEGALYCKKCDYSAPLEAQEQKVLKMKNDARNIVLNFCQNPLFLVCAILFSSILFLNALSTFLIFGMDMEYAIGAFLSETPYIIFMTLTVVGMWQSFAANDKSNLRGSLKRVSLYDAFLNVVFIIVLILFLLAACIGLFTPGYGTAVGAKVILIFVYVPIIIALCSFSRAVCKDRRDYFLSLIVYSESAIYTSYKSPVVGSIIVGSLLATAGFAFVAIPDLADFFYDYIRIDSGLINLFMLCLCGSCGAFYICSGVWMSSVHNAILDAKFKRQDEEAVLSDIKNKIKESKADYQREINLAEMRAKQAKEALELQRKKEAEEEIERQRQREIEISNQAKEHQMLMMQMMMQKMMSDSGVAPMQKPSVEDERMEQLRREKEEAEKKAKEAEDQQKLMMQMMQQMMANMNNNSEEPKN